MQNRNIDIIIPVYNVEEDILFRCISSIACQSIIKELEITIVDDASDKKFIEVYDSVVNRFKGLLDIKLLRYEVNGGPGVARQYGLDHTSNNYIMFIDADDTLNGSFACKILRTALEADNGIYILSVGAFDEVKEYDVPDEQSPIYIPYNENLIWVFGKMYRRSFLDKYNIRFHPTSRSNEDNGFNSIIRLISNKEEQINFIPDHVYYWHENLNSITRTNDHHYTFGTSTSDSFYGYVENILYAIEVVKKYNIPSDILNEWILHCMLYLYSYYLEAYTKAQESACIHFNWCKRFYDEAYKPIEHDIPYALLCEQYTILMRKLYSRDRHNFDNIIPHITIFDFLNELKK